MTQPNKTEGKDKKETKNFSSTIFNLVALALLLAVIVLLHNAYKKHSKPDSSRPSETVTIDVTKEEKVVEKIEPAVVDLSPDKTALLKNTEYKEVKSKKKKKHYQRTSHYNNGAREVRELDGEQARIFYLEQNRRLSKGEAPPTPYQATYQPTYQRSLPRSADLDDESARLKYLEENKRLSRHLAQGSGSAQRSSEDYVPFERR